MTPCGLGECDGRWILDLDRQLPHICQRQANVGHPAKRRPNPSTSSGPAVGHCAAAEFAGVSAPESCTICRLQSRTAWIDGRLLLALHSAQCWSVCALSRRSLMKIARPGFSLRTFLRSSKKLRPATCHRKCCCGWHTPTVMVCRRMPSRAFPICAWPPSKGASRASICWVRFTISGKLAWPVDYAESFQWALKAAKRGHPIAQHNVATDYLHGTGVTKDEQQALYWYQRAAEQGFAHSEWKLGEIYFAGNRRRAESR